MTLQRLLGTAWASVHGPNDPARLLQWICEVRFRGIVPAPGVRPVDWAAVGRLARDYPVTLPAVRASSVLSERPATAGLASASPGERQLARRAVDQAIQLAATVGARYVILEPGLVPLLGEVGDEDLGDPAVNWTEARAQAVTARRKAGLDAALDAVCRSLHAICRDNPDLVFALTPGRSLRAVAGVDSLTAIFEDLSAYRLAYWHDAAVVARREQVLGEPQGAWLEAFSNSCIGCTLGDARPEGIYLPPGSGGVDYPLVTSYLRRAGKALHACLELDPAVAAAELPGVRACLEKFGL
jgi:sugar phosphate isomerase/epimerase